MKSITIKGSKRESVGKKATKALRNAEKVPCVLYGGEEPIHFSAETKDLKPLVFTPNVYTAEIDVDGSKALAIMQDVQFHPVSDAILHIDFYQLHDDKPVTMNIPVRLEGTSVGVIDGGVLRFPNRTLSVTCLPKDLPDFITVDISPLKIGDKVFIHELSIENATFNQPENTVVCQVRIARAAITVETEEDEEGEGEEGEEGSTEGEGAEGENSEETKSKE